MSKKYFYGYNVQICWILFSLINIKLLFKQYLDIFYLPQLQKDLRGGTRLETKQQSNEQVISSKIKKKVYSRVLVYETTVYEIRLIIIPCSYFTGNYNFFCNFSEDSMEYSSVIIHVHEQTFNNFFMFAVNKLL